MSPVIRSGQNHRARHNGKGEEDKVDREEVGRKHQGIGRLGLCQVPEGSGEQKKVEDAGCEVICGASMDLAVKG